MQVCFLDEVLYRRVNPRMVVDITISPDWLGILYRIHKSRHIGETYINIQILYS